MDVEGRVADNLQQLPPIEVEPSSAPFELPATHKTCPDCAREVPAKGITYPRNPLRPLTEFYKQKSARYEGGYRYSAYCRPHQQKRNRAYWKPSPQAHAEQQRRWSKETGYEERRGRGARAHAWDKQHKGRALARWHRWVAKNPKKRRAQALASYHRRRGEESPPFDQREPDQVLADGKMRRGRVEPKS